MKPVFANSATIAVPECLVLARGGLRSVQLGVRFGVWVHPKEGPVLIDTGYGPEVTSGHRGPMLSLYARILKPQLEDQPEDILARLGFSANDVRILFVTHFHADHISGLRRFPNARFVAAGWTAIKAQTTWQQIRHGIFAELIPSDFGSRLAAVESLPRLDLPFGEGRDIFGDGRLVALLLPGHATGHCGLVWPEHRLIYAADAQWLSEAMRSDRPPRGPARLVYDDECAMAQSLTLLRAAEAAGYKIVLCHDPLP